MHRKYTMNVCTHLKINPKFVPLRRIWFLPSLLLIRHKASNVPQIPNDGRKVTFSSCHSKYLEVLYHMKLSSLSFFVSKGDMYNYADDNCISISHKNISVLSKQLENETRVLVEWFADNSMKANTEKFQWVILLTGSRNNADVQVSLGDVDIAFVQKIDVLDVCIDGKLNFN